MTIEIAVICIISLLVFGLVGEYLIKRYFQEKESFIERLESKMKGPPNAQG